MAPRDARSACAPGRLRRRGLGRFVGLTATPSGDGVWVLTNQGQIVAFGDARDFATHKEGQRGLGRFVGLTATPSGDGVWALTNQGQIVAFGDARDFATHKEGQRGLGRFVGLTATPPATACGR